MSVRRYFNQRIASWRAVVACTLIAVLAFAPVVRAACDVQHAAELVAGGGVEAQAGAASAPQPADHDACCDDSVASVSADIRLPSDVAVSASSATFAWLPTLHAPAYPQAVSAFAAGRFTPLPPEPVLKRVRKLLI